MPDQIADRDEVVGPGGHDGQWVEIEADNVSQNLAAEIVLSEAALFPVFVVLGTDTVNSHDQERTRTAGGIEQAFVGIANVAKLVKNVFSQPIWGIVFA